jgi:hypothetical protein
MDETQISCEPQKLKMSTINSFNVDQLYIFFEEFFGVKPLSVVPHQSGSFIVTLSSTSDVDKVFRLVETLSLTQQVNINIFIHIRIQKFVFSFRIFGNTHAQREKSTTTMI